MIIGAVASRATVPPLRVRKHCESLAVRSRGLIRLAKAVALLPMMEVQHSGLRLALHHPRPAGSIHPVTVPLTLSGRDPYGAGCVCVCVY